MERPRIKARKNHEQSLFGAIVTDYEYDEMFIGSSTITPAKEVTFSPLVAMFCEDMGFRVPQSIQ